MNIGIDARLYGPKWGGGGLGRYVEELVTELQRIESEHRYVLFVKPENAEACKITNPRFEKVVVDAHWYTLKEQLLMPKAIKKAGVDMMHYPHWNVPIFSKVPFVVTIHDLILLDDPTSAKATTLGPIRYAIKRLGYHAVLGHAIEKSKKVIAVSRATKESILRHFNIPAEKIQVIYEGVMGSGLESGIQEQQAPPKFPIPDLTPSPYFLYVGSAYPHKNLENLLRAFAFFVKPYPDTKLVLVGSPSVFYDNLRKKVLEIGIPEDRVVFTGFVTNDALSDLYAGASLYVFPSRFEGFGLPPLEAMSNGTPVAASSMGSLPEVLAEAALYFNPDDVEEMSRVMEQGLTNETLRAEMKKRGKEHVKKFSFQTMAKETVRVYEEAKGV